MITVPHSDTEADEAEWWFKNQDLLETEFLCVKPTLGPSPLIRMHTEAQASATMSNEFEVTSAKNRLS